jgi:hypothetical protein
MVFAFHDSNLFHQARMCNYSKGGMCFIADTSIKTGSDIYLMMENYLPDTVGDEFYDGYLAEVRWCHKAGAKDVSEFKVGVRYYQTVIR